MKHAKQHTAEKGTALLTTQMILELVFLPLTPSIFILSATDSGQLFLTVYSLYAELS